MCSSDLPGWFGYPGVDAVYWSLRIEVHFYIAVAAVLLLQQTNRTPMLIAIWLGLSFLNALIPIWRLDFLLCLSWAPYLAAGVLFYSSYKTGLKQINGLGLLCCLGLAQYYGYKSAVQDGYEIPIISCTIILFMFLFFACSAKFDRTICPIGSAIFLVPSLIRFTSFTRSLGMHCLTRFTRCCQALVLAC